MAASHKINTPTTLRVMLKRWNKQTNSMVGVNYNLQKLNTFALQMVSIFSMFFEKILEQQLSDFFENILNPYLCAFRRGHGCQTTLLRLLEVQ
jgi:hypothetical protein